MAERSKGDTAGRFGHATQRVLGGIDPDAGAIVRGYLDEPLSAPELLVEQTRLYLKQLEGLAHDGELIDLEIATELTVRCERLLDEIDEAMTEEHRCLVQAAVRYFIESDDADGDVDSLIGFDDDNAVIEAVAIAIDRAHVLGEA